MSNIKTQYVVEGLGVISFTGKKWVFQSYVNPAHQPNGVESVMLTSDELRVVTAKIDELAGQYPKGE